VQGARDGRGRHGENVNLGAHLLDALFVADSEALLFVDYEQAEVGELYVFREQAMGADEDIDFPHRYAFENFLHLFRGAETADHFDLDGERGEALLEGFPVLEGQHGGGREDGDLLVVAEGLEGRAHGDFSFAVAYIAAEQAIHGELGLHVALDVGDGLGLIVGFAVFEGVFEFFHPLGVGGVDVTLRGLALGVELE